MGSSNGSPSRLSFFKGLLVGILGALLIAGFAYAGVPRHSAPDRSGHASASVNDTSHHDAAHASAAAKPRAPSVQQQCHQLYLAQGRAERAAAASLSQWEVHVGAMNKLVTGQLTLRQANAFWNRTRVGASRLLDRYDAAVARLSQDDVSCPASHGTASTGVQACRAAIDAQQTELRTARIALATWRHHVRDMEMLRMGQMSGAQATRMWLKNWHRGVRQLDAYRSARKLAAAQYCQPGG